MPDPQFIVNGISRFDVKQGHLGDCWFVASMAMLSLREELLRRVVPLEQDFGEEYAGLASPCGHKNSQAFSGFDFGATANG